jgi:hypothetical protein
MAKETKRDRVADYLRVREVGEAEETITSGTFNGIAVNLSLPSQFEQPLFSSTTKDEIFNRRARWWIEWGGDVSMWSRAEVGEDGGIRVAVGKREPRAGPPKET